MKAAKPTARQSSKRSQAPEQLPLFKRRGGKRKGAGRPPARGARPRLPHTSRPFLHARHPVHVTLRVVPEIRNLRRRRTYHAIRKATLTTARRANCRIVHLSIQRNHLHLLVEASDKEALSVGMQGFQISAAKHLNRALTEGRSRRRQGKVFEDRYYAEVITSPRQARNTLNYVLNNWRKHEEDRTRPMCDWKIDWFSSATSFLDWAEYDQVLLLRSSPPLEPLSVAAPRTWLLQVGWKKSSLTISCREVPSTRR